MSELRRDPITGRWNIIVTDDPAGPGAFEVEREHPHGGQCPFCYGHEAMTPPEIDAVRPEGGAPNTPGWTVRVVPNKFPALKLEGELERRGLGIFDQCNGIGTHELIVETPDHARQMADLTTQEFDAVLGMFRKRLLAMRQDRRLRYALLFKNVGLAAGASLEHTHTQLIALPIVPKRVKEEVSGAERYFSFRGRCVFCDLLSQEAEEQQRIVIEHEHFMAVCPYVSSFPFEVWILPRQHQADFADLADAHLTAFGHILKAILGRMRSTLFDPPYNFILHSAPLGFGSRDDYHWHLELTPKLTRIAGFEWGTGFYINPTPPELAAKVLREAA